MYIYYEQCHIYQNIDINVGYVLQVMPSVMHMRSHFYEYAEKVSECLFAVSYQ